MVELIDSIFKTLLSTFIATHATTHIILIILLFSFLLILFFYRLQNRVQIIDFHVLKMVHYYPEIS